jgi:hypothetical protein
VSIPRPIRPTSPLSAPNVSAAAGQRRAAASGDDVSQIWIMYRGPNLARCELARTQYGLEVRTFLNGTMLVSCQLPSAAAAMRTAVSRRDELVSQGWTPIEEELPTRSANDTDLVHRS